MSDIFQEIEQELKRDNFVKLWKQYGKYVVALAVAVVIVTAAVVAWREYQSRQRAAEGERVVMALSLLQQGKAKEANEAFAALAQDSGRRAVLAKLEEAALIARGGDTARAAAEYEAIAADPSADPAFRDLATILAAQYGLATADPKAVIQKLQGLTANPGPWQPSAIELTALAQLKAGDKAAARSDYQKLADDQTVPPSMRSRAAEMAAALAQ